jgi:putative ABC transport system permease protein
MTLIRLLITRLRRDQLPALLLAGLVLVTALLAATAPRLFNNVADAGLRYQVADVANVAQRNLQLGRITFIDPAGASGMEAVAATETEIQAGLPPSVRSIISSDSYLAESFTWRIPDRPPERPGFLNLRFQGNLDDQIRLVDGRMPSGEVGQTTAPGPTGQIGGGEELPAMLFEVALSTTTAEDLGAEIGDRLELVPDPDDPLVGQFGLQQAAVVEVVGLYEVVDPNADFWVGDYALDRPTRVPVGINVVLIYATALLSPDAYPALGTLHEPMRYTFRYYVDPERIDAGQLDRLVVDLQQMEASYAAFASGPSDSLTTLQTGLLDLTQDYLAERRTSEAVLTTAAIGPTAVAIAAIAMVALLAVQRRRGALILLRGRGGSAWQLVGSHLVEGMLLTVAPAAAAALMATALVEGRATPMTPLAAGLVALGTILVLAATALPVALSPLRRFAREAPAALGASPRRLAFEGLAVGLAVGGIVLLRQRGLAGGSAAGELAGVDPFLAAVPALVGLAVAIVTIRLYPYPVRAAGWIAGGGRGLVPALGLRRAERQVGTGHLPLIVLLLTIAIGTFSSTMLATIDRGQVAESWQSVGAAYRISGESLPADFDVSQIPGVVAVAGAHEADASLGIGGSGQVPVIAVDAADYERVTAGTPAATSFPSSFKQEIDPYCTGELSAEEMAERPPDERPDCPGSTSAPIPAIVSRDLARSSTTPLRAGDTFELTFAARFATFEVVQLRDDLAGQPAGSGFVIVPRELVLAAIGDRQLPTTTLFIAAPPSAAAELRDAVAASGSEATVESQAERVSILRDRPLVEAVSSGFLLAMGIAVAFAALAVILSLLMSGAARTRETAHLRTLGIARRQITALTIIEHGPLVLVAVVAGLLLGVAVASVVLPGLGLSSFTGADVDPTLTVDIGQLAVLTGGLVVIVAIGVALAAWVQRRTDPAAAVREGLE